MCAEIVRRRHAALRSSACKPTAIARRSVLTPTPTTGSPASSRTVPLIVAACHSRKRGVEQLFAFLELEQRHAGTAGAPLPISSGVITSQALAENPYRPFGRLETRTSDGIGDRWCLGALEPVCTISRRSSGIRDPGRGERQRARSGGKTTHRAPAWPVAASRTCPTMSPVAGRRLRACPILATGQAGVCRLWRG